MGRYCHDSAGTVSHQYIVRYPYRDFFTVDGIGSGQTLDADTGLILCQLGTFEIRLFAAISRYATISSQFLISSLYLSSTGCSGDTTM